MVDRKQIANKLKEKLPRELIMTTLLTFFEEYLTEDVVQFSETKNVEVCD